MPKVKPTPLPSPGKKKRVQYTMEMKMYACQLRDGGNTNSEIREKVFNRFDELKEEPPVTTVCTWYNDHYMKIYKGMAKSPDTSQRKRLSTS